MIFLAPGPAAQPPSAPRPIAAQGAGDALAKLQAIPPGGPASEPVWVRRPTADEIRAAYPATAAADGVGGQGVVVCRVEADFSLSHCYGDDPKGGYGFTQAALSITPLLRVRPKPAKTAMPQTVQVLVSIRFEPTGARIAAVPYTASPSPAEVRAAPAKRVVAAGLGGQGRMRCTVAGGLLSDCRALGEEGDPFGRAALKLAPQFAVAQTFWNGRATEGAVVDVPVTFDAPKAKPAEPVLENPVRFIRAPSNAQRDAVFPAAARDHGVTRLVATEACIVAPDGSLTRCRTTKEEPTGLGGAQAAARLVNAFQLPTWSRDGRPIAGAPVTVDIVWDRAPKTAAP